MPFSINEQFLDLESGFHVIELKNRQGHKHIVQIAIGHDSCPACGVVHPKDNLDDIDPRALVAEIIDALNKSHEGMLAHAAKHGIAVK